jgi:muramoyltetrapeptide carboxypeptidase
MKDLDTPYGKTVEEIILDSVADYDFPVIFNFPAGHSQPNMSLKMGCETRIESTENGIKITQ